MTNGFFLKIFEIFWDMPKQLIVFSNRPIFCYGTNETNFWIIHFTLQLVP